MACLKKLRLLPGRPWPPTSLFFSGLLIGNKGVYGPECFRLRPMVHVVTRDAPTIVLGTAALDLDQGGVAFARGLKRFKHLLGTLGVGLVALLLAVVKDKDRSRESRRHGNP